MSEQTPETEPAKRRFRVGRFILWCLGGLIVLGVGLFGLDQARSSRRTTSAIADLDASDPGWRLEELESARVSIPDKQNSALLCKELVRLLGPKWPDNKFDEKLGSVVPPERLDAERMKLLEDEMVRLAPIRRMARAMADMPKGKYQLDHAFNPYLTLLPDQQETRKVANLFRYEMLYLSNTGDVTGAMRSGRACVCVGRSIGDEPILISQMLRIVIVSTSLEGIEKARLP